MSDEQRKRALFDHRNLYRADGTLRVGAPQSKAYLAAAEAEAMRAIEAEREQQIGG